MPLLQSLALAARIVQFLRLGVYIDAGSLSGAVSAPVEDVAACLAWLATLDIVEAHTATSFALAPRLGGPKGPYKRPASDNTYPRRRTRCWG